MEYLAVSVASITKLAGENKNSSLKGANTLKSSLIHNGRSLKALKDKNTQLCGDKFILYVNWSLAFSRSAAAWMNSRPQHFVKNIIFERGGLCFSI